MAEGTSVLHRMLNQLLTEHLSGVYIHYEKLLEMYPKRIEKLLVRNILMTTDNSTMRYHTKHNKQ